MSDSTHVDDVSLSPTPWTVLSAYLVVLAVSVHHPVLAVGADLQLEGGNVVRLLCLLGDGALRGDACQDFEELEVDLRREQWSSSHQMRSIHDNEELWYQLGNQTRSLSEAWSMLLCRGYNSDPTVSLRN